jgi:hypothetical protein
MNIGSVVTSVHSWVETCTHPDGVMLTDAVQGYKQYFTYMNIDMTEDHIQNLTSDKK